MGRIRILSDNVANKIAAGEVVERPASVVKELLENSLDAGAKDIRVDVENAGRRLIRLRDDGCGMLRDDALLAFERHATSKLANVKDLLAIATLGFRGEALPSVASVSRLLLETRSAEEPTGTAVEIAGGKLLRCDEIARDIGTTITARDLFFNVPARKKFLRSDQTELAHIGSLMTHYSLGHSDKRFELYHEGGELLNVTPVESRRDRAFQVFGSDVMQDLVDLHPRSFELPLLSNDHQPNTDAADVADAPQFTIEGLVSGPHVQKLNRNSVFLFVNGRLIRDRVLLHAISAAYQNLIPAGVYPFALLFLNCDPGEVDVNVHPSKTEVRFRHGSAVHDFVRDAVRDVLMESRPVSSIRFSTSPQPIFAIPQRPPAAPIQRAPDLPFSEFSRVAENVTVAPEGESHEVGVETDGAALPEMHIDPVPLPAVTQREPAAGPDLKGINNLNVRRVPDSHGPMDHLPPDLDYIDTFAALPELYPVGQLHESFILATGRDGLWIIDQHVAHERILFEHLLRQRTAGTVEIQQLLMPVVLNLSVAQQVEYPRIEDELNAHGFETEPFGQRTIVVKAAPAGIPAGEIEKILFEILEIAEQELRHSTLEEIRRSICATIACRAAIKINTRLEPKKMEWLLRALSACDYPMTCPHGRPIALRYSTKDILKSFHRL